MTALLIKSNGETISIKPTNGVVFTLQELQQHVGGYVEILLTKDQRTMIVNEEGRLRNFEVNDEASKLIDQIIVVGDVVVCDWSMIEGN